MNHFPGHKKTTETPYLEALVDLIQSLQLHPLPSSLLLCISYSASPFVPKISGIYSSFKPLDLPGEIFQNFWLTSSCHLVLRAFMLISWRGILSPTPYSIHIISYLGLLFFLSLSFFLPPCLTPPPSFHFYPSIHLYLSLSIVYIFIL